MQTAAAATVRGSTKWRTCGASIAARSGHRDGQTAPRPSVWRNGYATTGNVAAMARSANVVPAVGRRRLRSSYYKVISIILHAHGAAHTYPRARDERRRVSDRRAGWGGGGRDESEWQPSLPADFHPIETLHGRGSGGCTDTWGKRPHRDDPSPHAAMIVN